MNKIIIDNLEKIEKIEEEQKTIYNKLEDAKDIRRYGTIGEYEKVHKEIIEPNTKRQKLLDIQKAICYNNLACISYNLFVTDFLEQLKQFKNKNIGDKTRDKINKILENILLDNGLRACCYYDLHSYNSTNVLTFNFLMRDKNGFTYGLDSHFLSIRLEIPTSFHLFDKIEEAKTNSGDNLEIVDVENIDAKAQYLQLQHDLLTDEIDKTIEKLKSKTSDYRQNIKGNLYNLKSIAITYKIDLY